MAKAHSTVSKTTSAEGTTPGLPRAVNSEAEGSPRANGGGFQSATAGDGLQVEIPHAVDELDAVALS